MNQFAKIFKQRKVFIAYLTAGHRGLSYTEQAAKTVKHADGFVVGSAFVSAITHGANTNDLQQLAAKIDPR